MSQQGKVRLLCKSLSAAVAAFIAVGTASAHQNIVDIKVAPNRLWQCGNKFFATGGSESYRYALILVDGTTVAKYDFAREEDCTRVTTISRDIPDGGRIVVKTVVGNAGVSPTQWGMDSTLTGRDWSRRWNVLFFVDQAWGEVAIDRLGAAPPEQSQTSPAPTRGSNPRGRNGGGQSKGGQFSSGQNTPAKLFELWNTGGCGQTDVAEFDVSAPTYVGRMEFWANWQSGEQALPFQFYGPRGNLGHGNLGRAGCDSYQSTWCVGTMPLGLQLEPGHYRLQLERPALCQNGGSNGRAFIRIWGN